MSIITIVGSGVMGSAMCWPARDNGHEVRLVGTHLDREIIDACRKTGRHPKFVKDFPAGITYYQIEELAELAPLHNHAHVLGIKAVQNLLPKVPQTVVFDTSKESFEIYEELSQISEEIEECRSKNC